MSLVVDVYNRLHLRDDITFCPSCRRILYIPEDMTPEMAINPPTVKKPKKEKKAAEPADEPADDNTSSSNIAIQ